MRHAHHVHRTVHETQLWEKYTPSPLKTTEGNSQDRFISRNKTAARSELDSPGSHGSLNHAGRKPLVGPLIGTKGVSQPGTTMMQELRPSDSFRVDRHGDIAAITPASEVE